MNLTSLRINDWRGSDFRTAFKSFTVKRFKCRSNAKVKHKAYRYVSVQIKMMGTQKLPTVY